ncbi:MAG: hypothetical protein GTO40_00305 [Deltaproteobacteria bacterium]|nr:hypothetical protein [Deltaproteobacteria bacterium]
MLKHFDKGSRWIIAITLVLFIIALFVKGLTQDMLLETGIFLVSVKLVIMAYKISVTMDALDKKLDQVSAVLIKGAGSAESGGAQ